MAEVPAIVEQEPDYYLFPEITHVKKRAFLTAFARVGALTLAGQISGIDDRNHYNWLRVDEVYARCYEQAKDIAADGWEDEACRRAFHGTDKPVFYKGEFVNSYKEFSDTLAMFMLNGHRPQRFRRKPEDAEPADTPRSIEFVQFNIVVQNQNPSQLRSEGVSSTVLAGNGNGHQAGREGVAQEKRQGQDGLEFHNFEDVS